MNLGFPGLDYQCQNVAIFGAGKSGLATAKLCSKWGLDYCIYDEGGQGDSTLFTEDEAKKFDTFIFSPGFSKEHQWLRIVEKSDGPCFGELGFSISQWRGKVIGVTGTNGKTTVTSLLKSALNAIGVKAVTAGNIGQPLSELCFKHENCEDTWAICEISSFQAELNLGIQLDALIWTNFAEDHLDRHASLESYFAAKCNLLSCLKKGGHAVVGDSVIAMDSDFKSLGLICEPVLASALSEKSPFCSYPQLNNLQLAAQLWEYLELPRKALIDTANQFKLAPHRLSKILEWKGVSFWDDSKATNFNAALAALDAMPDPIHWICGGACKGGDVSAFASKGASKAVAIFTYGEVSNDLSEALQKTHCDVQSYVDFEHAVLAATQSALLNPPSVVLLSPGFSSIDQFKSYTERGELFISTVLGLKNDIVVNKSIKNSNFKHYYESF